MGELANYFAAAITWWLIGWGAGFVCRGLWERHWSERS